MSRHVIVIGDPTDPHVEAVLRVCAGRGVDCDIISDLRRRFSFSVADAELPTPDRAAQPLEPTSVWWRRKPDYFRLEHADSFERFRDREWQHALDGLEDAFSAATWVNPRSSDRKMRHKPNQLSLASRCGLAIPRTLISNDPETITAFVDALPGGRGIYKPLSWFHIDGRSIFANVIDVSTVKANAAALSRAPGVFQELIPKRHELRITLVGDRIFPVRIDSQSRDDTRIDWRRNQIEVPYAAIDWIDPGFEAALRSFHAASGLVFGAYDVICTPDDQHVFLEVNPVGQWLWLEEAVGVGISDALGAVLAA